MNESTPSSPPADRAAVAPSASVIVEAPAFFRTLSGPALATAAAVVTLLVFGFGYLVLQSLQRPAPGPASATQVLTPPGTAQFAGQLAALEAKASAIQAQQKALDEKLPPAFRDQANGPVAINPFLIQPPLEGASEPNEEPTLVAAGGGPTPGSPPPAGGPSPLARAQAAPLLAAGFASARTTSAAASVPMEGAVIDGRVPPTAPPDPTALADTLLQRFAPAGPTSSSPAAPADTTGRQLAFLEHADRNAVAHDDLVRAPASPYVLLQGTVLPAILEGALNSDLPGQTTALLRRNVYDSASGRHLLLPRGARIIGAYDSRIVFGQRRILVAWQRLLLPSGASVDLHGMPGVDGLRAAGLSDQVNNHFLRLFGSALALSAISAGAQLSQPQQASSASVPSASQVAAAAVGQELAQVGTALLQRHLNVAPTLEIRPGYPFNVELTADLVFAAPPAAGTSAAAR